MSHEGRSYYPVQAIITLDSPLSALGGAAKFRKALADLKLETVRDLLLWTPFRVDEYGELRVGSKAIVEGVLVSLSSRFARNRASFRVTEGVLEDEKGNLIRLVWFKDKWVFSKHKKGDRLRVAGEVGGWPGRWELKHPKIESRTEIRRLEPVYHLAGNLRSADLQALVGQVIGLASELEEVVPAKVRLRQRLLPIAEAVRIAHLPTSPEDFSRAQQTLQFAAVFELQVGSALLKRQQAKESATPVPYRQEVIDAFKAGLGFDLTNAQRRATWQIFQDLQRPHPMNRLLDGDVGSGKTAVAAAAVAMTHAAGLQSIVMAPTEILARQHLHKLRAYLEDSFPGLTVELLVSGLTAPERRRVKTAAASGHCACLVGTHALIEEDVQLAALGLAVVDEQHRFGSRQRELLRGKAGAGRPHFLAMTATPIPRTLALAVAGEVDLSVIDELPPGRTPVATRVIRGQERDEAYGLVRREVAAGRQAFVICPLVEESEKLEAKAATVEFERLRTQVFPDLRLALVHGKLKEKDEVMRGFRARESDILVATSVIEVGVDVPNATVMLVEGADRFGLAQLHQFRGRVGRGADRSHCLLLADDPAPNALERLELLETVHDGFRLAEADLEQRGAGELLGTRQHGGPDAAMAALTNPRLLDVVRQEAEALLDEDPELAGNPGLRRMVERRLEVTSLT